MEDIFKDINVYWDNALLLHFNLLDQILKYYILKYIDIGFTSCKLHFFMCTNKNNCGIDIEKFRIETICSITAKLD